MDSSETKDKAQEKERLDVTTGAAFQLFSLLGSSL